MAYFAGVEGGATCSKLVLMNSDGDVIAWSESEGTNFFLTGVEICQQRIAGLVADALAAANLPKTTKLTGLGLALSGAEDENFNAQFLSGLKESYTLAEHYYLTSDSVGTIVTALENGGVVVIAGTGSSCRLLNPNGEVHGCGGWGHMIGDQGSAFWISMQAIRAVFDTEDGLNPSPWDISYVKKKMLEFYGLKGKIGILDHLHKKFDKPQFAQFCKLLAQGATEHKDLLCRHLFREAGRVLGQHVLAVAKFADKTILAGGLPIVLVGSVWKSWELLLRGFMEGLQPRMRGDAKIDRVLLYRLKASSAVGAAYLAAKAADAVLPVNFAANAELIYDANVDDLAFAGLLSAPPTTSST